MGPACKTLKARTSQSSLRAWREGLTPSLHGPHEAPPVELAPSKRPLLVTSPGGAAATGGACCGACCGAGCGAGCGTGRRPWRGGGRQVHFRTSRRIARMEASTHP